MCIACVLHELFGLCIQGNKALSWECALKVVGESNCAADLIDNFCVSNTKSLPSLFTPASGDRRASAASNTLRILVCPFTKDLRALRDINR